MKGKTEGLLVFGHGINDANYPVQPTVNGKQVRCPYYARWCEMLRRAYCPKYKALHPSYEGVTVCEDWLYFTKFKAWMQTQDWEGKQLDKDVRLPDNKVYSPSTCLFITQEINKLFTDRANHRGDYPVGVHQEKRSGKYIAQGMGLDGKRKSLGIFPLVAQASDAYTKHKVKQLRHYIATSNDRLVRAGLWLHVIALTLGDV